MNINKVAVLTLWLMVLTPFAALAGEWTADSLSGKWTFTHILMDGTREMKVDRTMEFRPDGTIINYDAAGNERGQARFEIAGDTLVYTDDNGVQNWKLVSFDGDRLHVDHRGAEMFFERQ